MHRFKVRLTPLSRSSINQKLVLIALTFLSTLCLSAVSHAQSQSGVRADLGKLSEQLQFYPAVDPNLYCYSPDNFLPFSNYPHGDYIASIASADNIVIFVHGFVPFSNQGKHNLPSLVKVWRNHLDIVEQVDDTAYCVVTWDSDYGHDDRDQVLAKLLTVLIPAVSDRRIRMVKPIPTPANIVLVGHSAGGNYIKYSVVKQNENKRFYSSYPTSQTTQKYRLRILTMGTPHLGTDSANNALMFAFLFKALGSLLDNQGLDGVAGFAANKSTRRGATMLGPVHNNAPLRRLNNQFRSIFDKRSILALAGIDDQFVEPQSAAPDFVTPFFVRASHDDFLRPSHNPKFKEVLFKLYGGNH